MSAFTKSLATVVLLSSIMPVSVAIAAQDKLQDIHELCAPHPYTPLSSEIPCTKALINASQDPLFNARDPATQLFVIGADKLLRSLALKHISEDDAREKFLRMMLETEDRHRPELASLQVQQQEQLAALQPANQALASATPPGTSWGSSTNDVDAKREEIADRIERLQSDTEQHELAAQNWSDTAQNLAGTGCSGIGAALCQGIGHAGVAAAQANRNKELNAANADRAEIRRLQRQSAQ